MKTKKTNKNRLRYQIKTHGYDFMTKLEKLIAPELKQLVIDEEKEEAVDLCDESKAMNLAALLHWFELHDQKKHGDNLMYYCWLNHEAFDVTHYWLALCPDPYRAEYLTELGFENREQILEYIEEWWTKHSIQCLYPSCLLFNEETRLGSETHERWQLFSLEDISDNCPPAAYIGTDDNFMFSEECIPLDNNSIVMPEEMSRVYPSLTLQVNERATRFWYQSKKNSPRGQSISFATDIKSNW